MASLTSLRLRAEAVDGGFQVSNGLSWSRDGATVYFTDSGLGTIYACDADARAGAMSNCRVLRRYAPEEGKRDGLAVDAGGCLWVALWDGWRVERLSPTGETLRHVDMPMSRPTSCCFGGLGLETLHITSASIRLPAEILAEPPLSDRLFALRCDVPGAAIGTARV